MLGMRPTQIVIFAAALVAAPLAATAETSNPISAHHAPRLLTKADVAATPTAPGWDAAYAEARADMLAGRFPAAVQKFEALLLTAPDASNRLLVAELLAACRTWAQGGFVLATPTQLTLSKPMVNRRTLDELAMLYTNAVFNGIYAGIVIDLYSKPDSPAAGILPPLGLAAVEAGIVALVDYTVGFRYGVPQSTVSGMYIGYEEALVWLLWHDAHYTGPNKWGGKAVATLTWGLGTAGALTGGVVGTFLGTTPGRAAFMGSAALWSGAVVGTLAGAIDKKSDTGLLAAGIALNLGAIGGALLGAQVSPSIARVRFIDLGGLCGGLLVGGLYFAAADKDIGPRGAAASLGIGMAAGVATAWFFTRHMEEDFPRTGSTQSAMARIIPTIAPTTNGAGMVLGVAGAL
jgi:hypothetical protein